MRPARPVLAIALLLSACGSPKIQQADHIVITGPPPAPGLPTITLPPPSPLPLADMPAVFIGDSVTAWWHVGLTHPQWIERGVSGQTCADIAARFKADVIDAKPASVHILCGTNDARNIGSPFDLAVTQAAITAMVDAAQAANITVILGTVTPLRPAQNSTLTPDMLPNIVAINQWIRTYAARKNILLAEYHEALVDADWQCKAQYMDDGIHPNAAGFAVMTPIAQKLFKL